VSLAGFAPSAESTAIPPRGGAHGILVPRFRNVKSRDSRFVRGYGIWGSFQRGAPSTRRQPTWMLSAMLEVLPRKENRIEIDEGTLDAWGVPAAKIRFSYGENESLMQADAESWMRQVLVAMRLRVGLRALTAPGGYVHELGGARMGTQSSDSVLNAYNQCWDARNLFVLDGAAFVSAGWQNPALTMVALALRACGYISNELARGAL
jgi:choline dehydrogenase-like flavoprotein